MRSTGSAFREFAGAVIVVVLLTPGALDGQMRTRRGTLPTTPHVDPYKVVATFHGKLKKLTKKEIVIEASDSQELVTFRRYKDTKFLDNETPIKPTAIDMESVVSVDAQEDDDLKLKAVSLNIGAPKEKPAEAK